MDIDEKPQATSSTDSQLEELASILEQLETYPNNVALIKQQIVLMNKIQMYPEVLDANMRLASLIMLSEDEWIGYLDQLIRTTTSPLTLDGFVDILEHFEQAEQDYLSLAVLLRHVEFVLGCVSGSAGIATTDGTAHQVNDDVSTFLTADSVRGMLRAVLARGSGLLTGSHLLWQPYLDWEMRQGDLTHVHEAFTERMSIPHSTMSETSSAYSSYLSSNWPAEYETKMVEATAHAQKAKIKWGAEKRSGKTREDLEQQIASGNPLQAFSAYIEWETDPRATNPKHERAPSSDPDLTRSVFERAIAFCATGAFAAEFALRQLPKPKKKGKHRTDPNLEMRETTEKTRTAYKEAEADFWVKYGAWEAWSEGMTRRAVRGCPQKGSIWAQHYNQIELSGHNGEQLAEVFETALGLGTVSQPADIADLFITRAASLSRMTEEPQKVLDIVSRGFDAVAQVSKSGDPSLRLEKFVLDWAETRAPALLDDVLSMADRPNKSRSSSYQMTLLKAGIETRRNKLDIVRSIFVNSIERTDLDWPEAVYEAFLRFETIHGSLQTLAQAMAKIDTEQQKLERRRQKASQEQMNQYYTQIATTAPSMAPTTNEVAGPIESSQQAEPPTVTDGPSEEVVVKRDRENTSILISGLTEGIDKQDIESYFIDCGHIKEINVQTGKEVAILEFRFADAVARALARDGKKLAGRTIHVSMLWRSTLFVTNFPRHIDEAALRDMFSQYGTVLDVRWPARKYADNRRFCYITMDAPASAQECLILNGMKPEGFSFPLTVLISDPAAKTKRSDDDQSQGRTLFVGGLNSKTTRTDVEQLLREHGEIVDVKLGWDRIKALCKGFAFVEMATEAAAKSCLTLTGSRYNGRILKVELNDPNHATKKPDTSSASGARAASDKRERTIRLHNLPEGTQEGVLQQELEKIVPVTRLEVFAKSNEAIAELTNQSDVGLILLRAEPFVFRNATITFSQQGRRPPPAQSETASALSFAPRAARRGGKAIAKPRPQAHSSDKAPIREPNDFRAFVESKNQERSEASKRKAEPDSHLDAKRPKSQ